MSGRPQTVKAKVKNFGTNTETFDVKAEIGTFSSTGSVSSLTPGTEVTFTFPDTWTPDTNGTYNMRFYTQLGTDQKASDDTAKGTVKVWKASQDILICVQSSTINNKDSLAYTAALNALGKSYDLWNRYGTTGNEELPPDLYQWHTILFAQSYYPSATGWSLNDSQIDSITAWLNTGTPLGTRNLFLSADDIGYGLGRAGATAKDSIFYFQYLRAQFLGEKNPTWIYPVPGECIISGTDSINVLQSYPDVIRPNPIWTGSEPVMIFNPAVTTDSAVMLKYDTPNFHTIYLADRYYELDGPANPVPASSQIRNRLVGHALSWFDNPLCRDVQALSIVAPSGSLPLNPLDVKVRVKNLGFNAQTFDVIGEIGAWSDTETVTNLAAGADTLVTFGTQWTPPSSGTYNIKSFTTLAGDQNPANDTASGSVLIFVHDVGTLTVVAPSDTSGIKPLDVKARVKNFGDPQTFDVIAEIGAYADTVTGISLGTGAESLITFSKQWTPPSVGNYTVKTFTKLGDDQNPANDTASVNITIFVDAGALAVTAPADSSGIKPLDVTAKVENFGVDLQSFEVIGKIGTWADTVNVVNLTSRIDTAITFNRKWTPPSAGHYTITVYTQLAGDLNAANDSSFESVTIFSYGDANSDGKLTISDVVYLINYHFKGGPAPVPLLSGDANCDGKVDVADVVYLINYLFKGGTSPCVFLAKTHNLPQEQSVKPQTQSVNQR